ncbi:DNA topoisomerase IV subunit A [Williamsoniiplasma somnilux]|uniref:DNA topoisomerase 4 subunit A n=1 Tax=Williamsoniiplasma somnilux TaxID=215578 RepID=A0A2K8NY63_9MOLU|nr:DNA topoisomerase IV subunit A [Williamsoniiplasma somnilux]ATZ18727.1 DNA topoisomerase IV subunit A [Williamsoniiplasma somnilux]
MAKKVIDSNQVMNERGIINYPLEDLMGDRFGRYAKYIIQERALPDVRDGLKPVQRRILYAMSDLNLWFDKPHKKSARVVGEVIGKYHPHGDTSIYDAMVRMSQTWKLAMPLIDMQGNNGSIDGDGAAAMRYTETRLAKISEAMLADLDKQTVLFAPNFDDSEKEPTVLPSYFPNILVNGSTGIAAGYATNIPPHNLGEIIDATIAIINTPGTRLDTILSIVKGPDFPTGGIVQGMDGIREAFGTGKGKVIINSKWHEEHGNIIIDEIPYEVVKQDLVRKIGDVVDANPGLGIREVRDETDRTGLRIAIELSDKANVEIVRKFLFKSTPLSVSYNYNNVVIVDKQPKQLGIIDILKAYINHYKDVFTKRSQFDLNKAEKRLEIVEGLIKVMSILDLVIKIIRNSTNRADAIVNLTSNPQVGLTEAQSTAVVDMRLYRLTSTDVVKLQEEQKTLKTTIEHLQEILCNPVAMDKEIVERLREVKKQFAIPRRSEITQIVENFEVELKDTLVEKNFHLWVSKDGYLKAIEPGVINKNEWSTFGRKPQDLWISHLQTTNLHHLILVSNVGTYYSIPLYKVTMSKWRDMGMHVNTVATMDGNEQIVAAFAVKDFSTATQQILITTKLGSIKRTPIVDMETKIFTRAFRLIKLADQDEIVSASLVTSKTNNVVIVTQNSYAVRYNIGDVPIQGAGSKGVKAANLKDDLIISGTTLEDIDSVFILTDKDNMKKVSQLDIPLLNRPKRGSRLFPERKRGVELVTNGYSVAPDDILHVLNGEDLYQEINLAKVKMLDPKDTTADTGINEIIGASLEKEYIVTNGDLPPISQLNEDEEEYVSKAATMAKKATEKLSNEGKVSSKVTITSKAKEEAVQKVNSYTSSLSDLLGDLSNVTSSFTNAKKEIQNKSKAKDEKDSPKIQLDFDDLFED